MVDQTTLPPKCHSFVGLDRQIGSSPPAVFYFSLRNRGGHTHTHQKTYKKTQKNKTYKQISSKTNKTPKHPWFFPGLKPRQTAHITGGCFRGLELRCLLRGAKTPGVPGDSERWSAGWLVWKRNPGVTKKV